MDILQNMLDEIRALRTEVDALRAELREWRESKHTLSESSQLEGVY